MAKHRLTAPANTWRGAAEYGVSQAAFDTWGEHFWRRQLCGDHDAHAACDCRSWREHRSRASHPPGWDFDHCDGRMATVLIERQCRDALMARELAAKFPWLDTIEVESILSWEPGTAMPVADDRAPRWAWG